MQGTWIKETTSDCIVVFIHGVLSSGDTCWRHKNGTYWPEILAADTDIGPIGIYEFTYKTGLFSGNYRLGDIVDALKEHLSLDGILSRKKIVFVCHSMGGIVARKFIVERATRLLEKETNLGLFLIASPSLGADYANWLTPLARFFGHSQADALRFSQSNAWLMDLDREFMNLKEGRHLKIIGKELVEDNFIVLKSLLKNQIVQPIFGARYFGEPFKVPNSDHFSIAKLENGDAIQHRLLVKFIQEFLDETNTHSAPKTPTAKQVVRETSQEHLIATDEPRSPTKTSEDHSNIEQTANAGSGSTIIQVGGDFKK